MTPAPQAVVQQAQAVDLTRLLAAIAAVESGNDKNAVGQHGERGLYQIMPSTWDENARESFDWAFDPKHAMPVARQILIKLKWEMQERRIEPSAYNLALAWRGGVGAVVLGKWVNRDLRDYAVRVENIFYAR